MLSILAMHCQQKNMMVSNVAYVITSYLWMVSIKSSNVFLYVMIHVKRTPMWWSSNPIKVNRWNFMSFVPNAASIEMAPLWPYDSMDSHRIGVCILMVNGTWVPLITPTFWKKNTSSECWRAQDWIEITRLVCKCQLTFFCSNPNMQCLEVEWNHLVSCFDLHSHVPIKLFYVCHIFIWLCSLSLIGPICGPSMFVTSMEHK